MLSILPEFYAQQKNVTLQLINILTPYGIIMVIIQFSPVKILSILNKISYYTTLHFIKMH